MEKVLIDNGRVLLLHTAAIEAGLQAKRTILLGSLPPAFRDGLPKNDEPSHQLLSDLQHLNRAVALADGTLPLESWLQTAAYLVRPLNRHQVFEQVLSSLALRAGQDTQQETNLRRSEQPAVPTQSYSLNHRPHFIPFPSKKIGMVGREQGLERVRSHLTRGRTAISQAASFTGLGGLGKTQLAVEYCHEYSGEYPGGVVWITADEDIDGQLLRLCDRTRWIYPSTDKPVRLAMLRKRIQELERALFVFDNVNSLANIEQLIPDPIQQCHVIVTSRTEVPGFDPVPIDLLDPTASIQLLCLESGRLESTTSAAALWIAEFFDGLPLALELAGAYLQRRPSLTLEAYADELQRKGHRAHGLEQPGHERRSLTKHEASIERTLSLTESILVKTPGVTDLLDLFIWSAAASLGWSLLSAALPSEDPDELRDALGLVAGLRILRPEQSASGDGTQRYRMHRLVQEVHRVFRPVSQHKDRAGLMLGQIGKWFEARRREFGDLVAFENEFEHLAVWQSHAQELEDKDAWVRFQWLRAYPHWHRGAYQEALAELQTARELDTQDRELRAHIIADSGSVLTKLGRYREAIILDEEALEIRTTTLSRDNRDTATSHNNVGNTCSLLGDVEKALKHATIALEIQLKILGEGHQDTARSFGNLGALFSRLGNHEKALETQLRALNIRKTVLGDNHPETAISYSNVGFVYYSLGNNQEALNYELRACDIHNTILGEKHPDTALLYDNLGSTYEALGNHQLALEWKLRALEIRRQVLGEAHPFTATSYNNIGFSHYSLKKYKVALDSMLVGLKIRKSVLGEEHPDTAASQHNVGTVYFELRYFQEALTHFSNALASRRRALGDAHPQTAVSFTNTVITLKRVGRLADALQLCKEALRKVPPKLQEYKMLVDTHNAMLPRGFRALPRRIDRPKPKKGG